MSGVRYFLDPANYARWVAPRMLGHRTADRGQIANTLLLSVILGGSSEESVTAIQLCRNDLGAQLADRDDLAMELSL